MKRAIVFAGGGSKGSYEFGAWSALRDLGQSFDIATGTSIGSINAGFYVQDDYEAAKEMWSTLSVDKIFATPVKLERSITALADQMDLIRPFLKSYINKKGADITPFIENLNGYANEDKFFSSEVDFGLVAVAFPSLIPIEVTKSQIKRGYFAKWIQASCACFPVFPTCEIDGKSYIDGGYYDNLPIATAFRLGAEEVVAIDLNTVSAHEAYAVNPFVKLIKPSRDLGAFMDFDREKLDANIRLGYNDTMKAFGKYYGNVYTFMGSPETLSQIDRLSRDFTYQLTKAETYTLKEKQRLFQRNAVNAPCTRRLTEYSGKASPEMRDFLIAAIEITAKQLLYPDDLLYSFESVFQRLRLDAYPIKKELEAGLAEGITAFASLRRDRTKEKEHRLIELKRSENDYEEIIAAVLLNELFKMVDTDLN
ncbi:MAG: patatin-like phospholipase family protein [Clostridiales bacterium]|nr:patatin-like phospholipase family protein [Clostridiales bacterium]